MATALFAVTGREFVVVRPCFYHITNLVIAYS